MPLAVSSTTWFFSNRFRLVTVQYPDRILSSSFASFKSLSRQNLASRPKPISSSLGLWFPAALSGPEVYLTRACQPATFRLQGLATLLAVYSLRSLAGFVSHQQRSWDSPFGGFSSRKVFELLNPNAPTYRFPQCCSEHRGAGPAHWVAVPGFLPFRKSLAHRAGF